EPPRLSRHARAGRVPGCWWSAAMTWARLSELLRVHGLVQGGTAHEGSAATVTGIAYDSRQVEPGNAFVALKGQHADGSAFARQAIERGAIAIVAQDAAPDDAPVTWTVVNDARRALALLATEFFGNPSTSMQVV